MAGDSDKITENGGNILSILIWLAGIGVIVGIVFFVIGAVRSGGDKLKSTISGAATQQFTQYDGLTKIPSSDVIGLATDVSIQGKGIVVVECGKGNKVAKFGDPAYGAATAGKDSKVAYKADAKKTPEFIGVQALSSRAEEYYVSPNDIYEGHVITDTDTGEVVGIGFKRATKTN